MINWEGLPYAAHWGWTILRLSAGESRWRLAVLACLSMVAGAVLSQVHPGFVGLSLVLCAYALIWRAVFPFIPLESLNPVHIQTLQDIYNHADPFVQDRLDAGLASMPPHVREAFRSSLPERASIRRHLGLKDPEVRYVAVAFVCRFCSRSQPYAPKDKAGGITTEEAMALGWRPLSPHSWCCPLCPPGFTSEELKESLQ
jgi:hypothetical protein